MFSIIGALSCFVLAGCNSETQPSDITQSSSTSGGHSTSQQTATYHTVTFNSCGGSEVISQQVLHGEKVTKPADPIKSGFLFDRWACGKDDWSFAEYTVTEDIVLDAVYSGPIYYSITYNLDIGTNDSSNPTGYTVLDSFTLVNPTKTGYSFLGWFDENNNLVKTIEVGTTGNLTLTGRWNEGNEYVISLNPNGGSLSPTTLVVQYNYNYILPTPTRDGYTFLGWYEGSTKVSSSGTWRYLKNKSYTAKWEMTNYPITYVLNGGENKSSNPSSYTISDAVTFFDPEKPGYTFQGWFDENNNKITSIEDGSTGEITLTASWTADLYALSVVSSDNERGSVSVVSGTGYTGESITVNATANENYIFRGWYHERVRVSKNATYTFFMPSSDYSLEARFISQAELNEWNQNHGVTPVFSNDGKLVTYGLYPQTKIGGSPVYYLNKMTKTELNGWYYYDDEYYAKLVATPSASNYKFDDEGSITSGTTYWFKCEPITWNVLSNNDGECYLLSSTLLDTQRYYCDIYSRVIDGETIYINNYKYSDVRAWLNGTFYNSAFALNDTYVQTTIVDNSASSTGNLDNPYACENTEDKVFLQSYEDSCNSAYFSSIGRKCKTTDWARARGAASSLASGWLNNGYYLTRSPCKDYVNAWEIYCDGQIIANLVNNHYKGVRPAITFSLS